MGSLPSRNVHIVPLNEEYFISGMPAWYDDITIQSSFIIWYMVLGMSISTSAYVSWNIPMGWWDWCTLLTLADARWDSIPCKVETSFPRLCWHVLMHWARLAIQTINSMINLVILYMVIKFSCYCYEKYI